MSDSVAHFMIDKSFHVATATFHSPKAYLSKGGTPFSLE